MSCNSPAVLFGTSTPGKQGRRWWTPRAISTFVGMLAIPLWATWPALALEMRELPALECVSLGFMVGWAVLRWIQPREEATKARAWMSWVPAVAFALAESGAATFFFMATQRIPAAEANLINYLWPGEI